MGKDIQGLKVNNRKLAHWDVLLKAWLSLIKRYCDFMEGSDAPFYHTERANVGVLAGAAWNAGWIALEEFGARKRRKIRGSCDLYLYPDDRDIGEYIEAKQAWSIEKAESGLSQAESNARELLDPKYEEALRIGLTFVSPGIHEKFESKINHYIDEILKTASKVDCDIYSWSFPVSVRGLRGGGKFEHIIYPGILLFAKVADEK